MNQWRHQRVENPRIITEDGLKVLVAYAAAERIGITRPNQRRIQRITGLTMWKIQKWRVRLIAFQYIKGPLKQGIVETHLTQKGWEYIESS